MFLCFSLCCLCPCQLTRTHIDARTLTPSTEESLFSCTLPSFVLAWAGLSVMVSPINSATRTLSTLAAPSPPRSLSLSVSHTPLKKKSCHAQTHTHARNLSFSCTLSHTSYQAFTCAEAREDHIFFTFPSCGWMCECESPYVNALLLGSHVLHTPTHT